MTIRGSFAFGAILASLVIALGFSPGRSEPAQPAENPSGGAPRYLDGIDRGAPPPALAPPSASPLAAGQAPHASPSAYAWGPPALDLPGAPAAGERPAGADDGDSAWSLHCEERVCFVQYVPGDFETVSSRRFAVNLGWSPSLGQFELETRFLAGAIGAEVRALSVEVNGRRTALLPFTRCNERGTCWYRALLADDQVERIVSALVLALVPLETHDQAADELHISAAGLRAAFARLVEAAPDAVAARRRSDPSPPTVAPPAAYTSPALDDSTSVYLPRITSPTR